MIFPPAPELLRVFDFAGKPATHYASRRVLPDHEEVLVLTGGSAKFRVENRLTSGCAGGVLWFYSGELLEAITPPEDPFECVVFLFRRKQGVEPSLPRMPRLVNWPSREESLLFAREALTHYQEAREVSPLFGQYCHTRLFWVASRGEKQLQAEESRYPLPLQTAITFARTRCQDPDLTTADIAQASGVSPSRLHQLCRAYLKTSPKQMVIDLRIQHAKDLLGFTMLSIKEIAHASGFHHAVHFSRAFKKATGLQPTSYRKAQAGE